jgi:hypothetical protein
MTQIPPSDIDPIAPAEARARLIAAIETRLGKDWRREDRWLVVHDSDYLIRLNQGRQNLDFACDLVGAVTVTEKEADPLQSSGWLIAGAVLFAWLMVAVVIARITGAI